MLQTPLNSWSFSSIKRVAHILLTSIFKRNNYLKLILVTIINLIGACIIPPDLEIEKESGEHQPHIESAMTNPPVGPLTVQQSANKLQPIPTTFRIWLEDEDEQILYARMFINSYGHSFSYAKMIPLPTDRTFGQGARAFKVDVDGLCDSLVNFTLGQYILEFWVSDTEFVSIGDDLRQNIGNGYRDNVLWHLTCVPAVK